MAESENLLLPAFAVIRDGSIVAYVRAAVIVNARPEAGRLIVRMRNDAEVGIDAMPGAFAKRTPQAGDMYVIQADGAAQVVARNDFLLEHRSISDHDIPGAPERVDPARSMSPALHATTFNPDGLAPFSAAPPTSLPPLSSWENPEDAPSGALPPVTAGPVAAPLPGPAQADEPAPTPAAADAPAPPATPIDLLSEREGKLDPNVEQPALSIGFVSTGAEATARDKANADAKQQGATAQREASEQSGPEADPGFGHYSPPAIPSVPERATAEFEHAVPPRLPQDQAAPAAPSPEPPVGDAPAGPVAPANAQSTIQYRDPAELDPVPAGTSQTAGPAPQEPTEPPPQKPPAE